MDNTYAPSKCIICKYIMYDRLIGKHRCTKTEDRIIIENAYEKCRYKNIEE